MVVPVVVLVAVVPVLAADVAPVEAVDQQAQRRRFGDLGDLAQRLLDEADLGAGAGDHEDDRIHQRHHDQRVGEEERRRAVDEDVVVVRAFAFQHFRETVGHQDLRGVRRQRLAARQEIQRQVRNVADQRFLPRAFAGEVGHDAVLRLRLIEDLAQHRAAEVGVDQQHFLAGAGGQIRERRHAVGLALALRRTGEQEDARRTGFVLPGIGAQIRQIGAGESERLRKFGVLLAVEHGVQRLVRDLVLDERDHAEHRLVEEGIDLFGVLDRLIHQAEEHRQCETGGETEEAADDAVAERTDVDRLRRQFGDIHDLHVVELENVSDDIAEDLRRDLRRRLRHRRIARRGVDRDDAGVAGVVGLDVVFHIASELFDQSAPHFILHPGARQQDLIVGGQHAAHRQALVGVAVVDRAVVAALRPPREERGLRNIARADHEQRQQHRGDGARHRERNDHFPEAQRGFDDVAGAESILEKGAERLLGLFDFHICERFPFRRRCGALLRVDENYRFPL